MFWELGVLGLVGLMGGCTACDTGPLNQICGEECLVTPDGGWIPLDPSTAPAYCVAGKVVCDPKTGLGTCEGYAAAFPNSCEDTQRVCANPISTGRLVRPNADPQNTCFQTEKGICRYADQYCVDGQWVCDHSMVSQEICNGFDDSCDGLLDAQDPSMQWSDGTTGLRFVYDGPPETANVGVCRPGVRRCLDGHEIVQGMVLPTPEVCGNLLDDDCDGAVDEDENPSLRPKAFMLVVDYSGSMGGYLQDLWVGVCSWAAQYPDGKFYVVGAPSPGIPTPGIQARTHGFVDAVTACSVILDQGTGIGDEYVPLGVRSGFEAVVDGVDPPVWPEGYDKEVIVFTDEEPQSPTDLGAEYLDFVDLCNHQPFRLELFGVIFNRTEWASFVAQCPSARFLRMDDPQHSIADQLPSVLLTHCPGP